MGCEGRLEATNCVLIGREQFFSKPAIARNFSCVLRHQDKLRAMAGLLEPPPRSLKVNGFKIKAGFSRVEFQTSPSPTHSSKTPPENGLPVSTTPKNDSDYFVRAN
jgi:hypothetical protein